jgi:putative transcriptional regulator
MKRRHSLLIAIAALCGGWAVSAQSTREGDLGLGKLLVASRDLSDPAFSESVILLVRYDEDGTVGLMINRRSGMTISRALRDLNLGSDSTDPVYRGGPVEPVSVLALLRSRLQPEGAAPVFGDVFLVSTKDLLEKTLAKGPGPGEFRVYLGYCGWSRGQLENEVRQGSWHIFNRSADLVFDSEPDSMWRRLIARVEQNIAERRRPPRVTRLTLDFWNPVMRVHVAPSQPSGARSQ